MANLYELDAIAAAIIGGTLLSGGRGTIVGSLLGVLIFTTITNLFAINNLSTEVQNMVKGGIIVAAVLVQQFRFSPSPSSSRGTGSPPQPDAPHRRPPRDVRATVDVPGIAHPHTPTATRRSS